MLTFDSLIARTDTFKTMNCHCGRPKSYENCCGKLHRGEESAQSAEDLMRSRYSAFVVADVDYLMRTHHSLKRSLIDKDDIRTWTKSVKWLGLEIINKSYGEPNDVFGTVEFKAHFKEGLFRNKIHENSKFVKEKGKWVYLDSVGD